MVHKRESYFQSYKEKYNIYIVKVLTKQSGFIREESTTHSIAFSEK